MDRKYTSADSKLLLERIEKGLVDEDESNAAMWRHASMAQRGRAIAELGDFALMVVRSRGFPVHYGELEFPGLPRTSRAS